MKDFLLLKLDGHRFHQLALDGISFARPQPVHTMLLSPGNRADVLVQGGAPGHYLLRKLEYDQGRGPEPETILAAVEVRGEPVEMELPARLPVPASLTPIEDYEIRRTRVVTFNNHPSHSHAYPFPRFTIDGKNFDPDRVDQTMKLGSAEEWTIRNEGSADHPFHIHINPFLVTQIGGAALATPVWQDTVIVPRSGGSVTFRTRFTDFVGRFVLHCHILDHEDLGMMQLVEVV
jgi:FtsP/CotA-like multicopper oxidase with cupredoxin domain